MFFAASAGVVTGRKKNNFLLNKWIALYLIYLDSNIPQFIEMMKNSSHLKIILRFEPYYRRTSLGASPLGQSLSLLAFTGRGK